MDNREHILCFHDAQIFIPRDSHTRILADEHQCAFRHAADVRFFIAVGVNGAGDFDDFTEAFPAFMTILVTAYTVSLANGISAGILIFTVTKVLSGAER